VGHSTRQATSLVEVLAKDKKNLKQVVEKGNNNNQFGLETKFTPFALLLQASSGAVTKNSTEARTR
jgi:hypothetical protein